MGRWAIVANGIILAGATFVLAFGFKEEATPLLSEPLATETQALESQAAHAPTTQNLTDLAAAYLDRNQPGLAISVLDRYPGFSSPELSAVRARALFGQGESVKALSVLRNLTSSCEDHTAVCPNWLLAKTLRQQALLEQMVSDGIEDAAQDPLATRHAYERSNREVRLVAVR
jgi:hypothetical protein